MFAAILKLHFNVAISACGNLRIVCFALKMLINMFLHIAVSTFKAHIRIHVYLSAVISVIVSVRLIHCMATMIFLSSQ